jgi:hypothetical protein
MGEETLGYRVLGLRQVALGMDAGQSGDWEWVGSRRMHV